MATIKLSTFVFNSDETVTVSLVNSAFNAVGDKWDNPTVVDFPVFFDESFVVAPAIVSGADVEAVKKAVAAIESTDENDTGAVKKLRTMLAKLPKRIFIRSFFRETILDIVDGNVTAPKPYKVGGKFVDALVDLCDSEVTAADLQAAVTAAADGKTVVAAADGYALNSRNRKYQLLKYDLE